MLLIIIPLLIPISIGSLFILLFTVIDLTAECKSPTKFAAENTFNIPVILTIGDSIFKAPCDVI